MRIWTDNVKCLITDLTAVIQASFLLPSLSTLLHHSALLFTFLSYSILSAEWEAPTWPRNTPPMFPLSPCPGQSTSPGTQQAARWASLAVWTRGLVRKEECVECKWTHTHTQSVKTHLHIHTANWNTPTVCWTRQADKEEEWHSFSCLSPFPSHPSSPPSAHSLCSSPGRMEGWTFTNRTQVRRICLPRGWRSEEGKVGGKERRV